MVPPMAPAPQIRTRMVTGGAATRRPQRSGSWFVRFRWKTGRRYVPCAGEGILSPFQAALTVQRPGACDRRAPVSDLYGVLTPGAGSR